MSTAIQPEDVVVALFAEVARKQRRHRFEADPIQLHPAFFDWRSTDEFGQLFTAFIFDTSDYFPYSETLDSVIDGLQFAGYLERTNPRGTWYQITPALQSLFETEVSKKLERKHLKAIGQLAEKFTSRIKTDENMANTAI